MSPDEQLESLQILIHEIVLTADDHTSRHSWQARDGFIDILQHAEEAEKIVTQLLLEPTS